MRAGSASWCAAAAAAAVLMAGCSAGPDADPGHDLPGTDMIAASRDRILDGGTLRIATQTYPENFNFQQIDSLTVPAVEQTTWPHFFTFDRQGNPVLDLDYATSIRVTGREPFTVTYDINPHAVWSNGDPIQFRDFYNDWRANRGTDKAYRTISSEGFRNVTSVRAGTSNRQVVITFDRPYAAWRRVFNSLPPASLTATPKAFDTAWSRRPLLSGGPFIISSADATSKTITETPNPRWWGLRPKLSRLVIRTLSGNAMAAAFANGEIDALGIESDANNLRRAQATAGTRILRAAGLTRYTLDLNGGSPVLRDVRIRRAIMQGVDRAAIAATRLAPLGVPVSVADNHIYVPAQEGYADTATAAIGYDPAKARAALDAAGWKVSGDVRKKGGKELSLRMVVIADSENFTQPAQQVQAMLRNIGVKVTVKEYPPDLLFSSYIDTGNFDLTYFYWTGFGPYPECEYSPYYPADSPLNDTHVSSERIGTLFGRACSTLDARSRRRITNEADRDVFRLGAAATVYVQPSIGAVRDDLANYDEDSSAFQTPDWVDVGFLK